MHPSARDQRPPLSPQDGWLSNGRQVLHFRPVRYERFSQALELTSGELIPGQVQVATGSALRIFLLLLQTLVFLAISGGLVLAAGGAAIYSTQKRRPAVG